MSFALDGLPVLSRSTVDRQEPLRDDPERQDALWPSSRVLPVDEHGRFPMSGEALAFAEGAALGPSTVDGAVLLGEHGGTAYWAVPAAVDEDGADGRVDAARADAVPAATEDWTDLRRSGALLDATAAGLAVTAVAVLGWHRRSPFCPRCGTRSLAGRAGWCRRCPSCGLEEYPRTDPAVICLVHDGADRVLVARGPDWPVNRFSVLAGFVEAGESLEACVAREVSEEVGVAVHDIRYLGSQPWPFPRSLMIGYEATADPDAPLVLAEGEIADARWVTREEVRKALASGSWAGREGPVHGEPGDLLLPGPVSIAGAMLRSWAG
ncbi:MAG TPA: NAD(+) diphosphatase [Pseudonocardiaceae bacterium]